MEKKYKIEFDGKELVFENEKEFKKFKAQCYNIHCDIMIDSQFNKGKVIRRPTGPDPEPEITLRDVVGMVKQLAMIVSDLAKRVDDLTLEVREGFRKVNERLDAHDLRFDKQDLRFDRIEAKLDKHEDIFKRNNLN